MPKKELIVFSDVKDDQLIPSVRQKIAAYIKEHNGKRLEIRLSVVGAKRSNRQNRYYWGVVIAYQMDCFAERWGEIWDKDQVHDWNKNNIWHSEIIEEETGEIIKKPGSSKAADKAEFEFRMEKLRQKFETDFNWRIPLPNEQIDLF